MEGLDSMKVRVVKLQEVCQFCLKVYIVAD